ncbi:AbrB/MazE/SpoVT family DNA-binding domain-containing protein [Guptibacillus hwajinpoensis]|uniref:Transcriptional pleiotropic regulator of transition state genes n=1 Tax=Guptibacillus hwajinpoensis TaxID=208199 RepID=A0ABU0K069_9BACL|nr:AbrB/MazE/SpoVT family DNA-binding domain-containing protein [Alkalihalobacillus hemicentroti]MDQ0482684.1 transcriptional pleiotropic regulator of transition state genes [Alkalihalobacillus hemicentroti]
MKSTGILRRVDQLGRIVIPIELRRVLGIETTDALEIFVENDAVILKKYTPRMTCQVTGDVSSRNISLAGGNIVLSPEAAKEVLEQLREVVEGN